MLVLGPSGEQLGTAANVSGLSGAPNLPVEVYAGDGRPGRGTPAASFGGPADQHAFDYELRSPGGAVGRLRNAGNDVFVLEPQVGVDAALRTLLVGVLCGLVDRRWWRLPHRPMP